MAYFRNFIQMNKGQFDYGDPKPEKTVKKKKAYKYVRKATGEKEIFEEIWQERPHNCQMCSCPIEDCTPTNFMHVLPKAMNKFPKFKLLKQNTLIGCEICHYNWDFKRHSIEGLERWKMVFELEDSLKEQYKKLHS